jgi:hypothetical protein
MEKNTNVSKTGRIKRPEALIFLTFFQFFLKKRLTPGMKSVILCKLARAGETEGQPKGRNRGDGPMREQTEP